MNKIVTFRDLKVWGKSHLLTLETYKICKDFPKYEEFGLSSQMRRSSASVPSNIAEGFKRKSCKDRIHFYNMAETSLEELKYQIILAKDLNYIKNNQYIKLTNQAEEVSKMLFVWKNKQK